MLSHALRASVHNTTIPPYTDANFNQVSLLLHGDGTNGAQNNTFIGEVNPAQYYGSFNGSTQYLTVPSSSAFAYGTGDFTIEFWFNASDTTWRVMYEQPSMVSIQWSSTSGGGGGAGKVGIYWSGGYAITSNIALSTATWYHLAVVRQSGVLKLYIDGVVQTTTSSTAVNITATTTYIGNYYAGGYGWNGKLSNLRAVKGTALYTSNFTPPTGNLTAISGTQLLTLQNATIVDNSTNNFTITNNGSVAMTDQYPTITRNGNTTQGTNTPFSQAAGYWSNYFNYVNPDANNLKTPASSNFNPGTGDFTVECWMNANTLSGNCFDFTSYASGIFIRFVPDLQIYIAGTLAYNISFSNTANTWFHFALVRTAGVLKVFKNGIQVGSDVANTTNIAPSGTIMIGASQHLSGAGDNFIGYISNSRYVVGTAVYTTTFTPPTTPLTAISGTQLLTCQSNYFKDNSSNNFTITATATADRLSVQPFSPFAPTSAYSTSVNGGSMYFDGTGDYLSTPSSTPLSLGTGDFTIEFWVYASSTPIANAGILSERNNSFSTNSWRIAYLSGKVSINTTSSGLEYGAPFTIGTWNHIAFVRSGTTLNVYSNGVLGDTNASYSYDLTNSNICLIGLNTTGSTDFAWNGYISNLRVVKGTAVYTTTFTPPTAPLTAITNTSLLLSGTNAGIYDNAIKNDLETVGDAQISTAVVKYGTGSMKFDGTGDSLTFPAVQQFAYGTGDFTIEFWFNASDTTWRVMYEQPSMVSIQWSSTSGGGGGAGKVGIYANGGYVITNNTALSTGTWYFLALVRQSGVLKLYIDGVAQTTTYAFANNLVASSQPLIYVGNYFGGGYSWNGYLDDLRITKGIARYTANFTPPTSAFPNQ